MYCCILPLIFLLNHALHAEFEGVLPKVDRDALPQAAHAEANLGHFKAPHLKHFSLSSKSMERCMNNSSVA